MPPSIFISYSHQDSSLVGPVVALLRASEALVFRDADSIHPGKRWREEIGTAISSASVVVVFWCHHARASAEVGNEIRAAVTQKKDILPLLIDETPLPQGLAEFQYIDFRKAFGDGHGFGQDRSVPKPAKGWKVLWWVVAVFAIILTTSSGLSRGELFGTSYDLIPVLVFGIVLVMVLLLTFSLACSYIERVRLTGQIASMQKEAQTERELLKQRERELASRNQEFEKEIADVSRRNEQLNAALEQLRWQQAAPPRVLSFLLAPQSVRSEKANPQSTIPLLTGKARLLMELDHDDYANYQVLLQTVEGREILRGRTGKVRFGKDRAFATLPVKAGELTKGDYILILYGQTADGKIEEIDRYFFRVS